MSATAKEPPQTRAAATRRRRKSPQEAGAERPKAQKAHRARMQLVGALLEPPLRELEADREATDAAGHELYLRIMSAAFQALDQMTQDMSLEDLRKLSRIVAEQRRADGMARRSAAGRCPAGKKTKNGSAKGDGQAVVPPLAQQPEFLRIVEQIYGTKLDREEPPEEA